ncbi:MAG TPA: hypothetical protein VKD71_14555 [Gemmataceae bacterium]|nr:hypothetical protein [Gemmataceae bacterium]
MNALYASQQLGQTRPTAAVGAKQEARPTSPRDAGNRGRNRDHEHDAEGSRSFLLTLLGALGAMHT